jgi:hypothetical protein
MTGYQSTHAQENKDLTMEQWMNKWMKELKAPRGALHVSRFADPTYVLIKPISWVPNPGEQTDLYQRVDVPVGFVTDFTSIPSIFWSLLRPDGEYTYPAIVHDYLYWTQTRTRVIADEIFKLGMQDFGISSLTISSIYSAVRIGGGAAWNKNAKLKSQGEKRILKRIPDDPRIRWRDWKKIPEVFAVVCNNPRHAYATDRASGYAWCSPTTIDVAATLGTVRKWD